MTCPTQAWVNAEQALFFLNGSQPLEIGTVSLSESGGVLLSNGVPIPSTWSIYNTESNIINFDDSNVLQIIGGFLYFNDQIIATQGDLSNISDWSLYPAIAKVQMVDQVIDFNGSTLGVETGNLIFAGVNMSPNQWSLYQAFHKIDANSNDISNAGNIYCSSIYGPAVGNAAFAFESTTDLNITVGDLANITSETLLKLETTGGTRGHIELTANGGLDGALLNGVVDITANPALPPPGESGIGGLINITANSIIGTNPESTQTSAVKISGASVLSYAGYIAPVLSTAGYNYVWGGLGVNIQSDVIPPIVPNTPGTVYLYGRLGVAVGTGTILGVQYGLFATLIQPYSDDGITRPDLYIQGKDAAKIRLLDVAEFAGSSLNMTGISQINSAAYVSGADWSGYAATHDVDMSNYSISNVSNINGLPPGANWSSYPATQTVDMSGNAINNADYVSADTGTFTTIVESALIGINNVNQIGYITKDTPGTGIQINSDNDISLLVGTAVGAPPGKVTNTGYYTTDILTPTLSNELTTKQYVDGRSGVVSLNSLTGALSITAGAGITITPSGTNVEVAMTQGPIKAYGNNTINVSALTTAAQNIGILGGITTIGTSRLVANATMSVLTNTNTIEDITYYITLNGAQIGAQMKHSFSGNGHWNTLAVTAISTSVAASTSNVIRLVALASVTTTFTVSAMNLNCTVDLA